MSDDFERALVTLCMTECAKAQGDSQASTETTQVIVNTLASVIAMSAGGRQDIALQVVHIIGDQLPDIVVQRAASFRRRFGRPDPTERPQ